MSEMSLLYSGTSKDAPINLPRVSGKSKIHSANSIICSKSNKAACVEGVFARFSVLSAQLTHTHQLFSSHP
ncbi:MAG: hypothetical protein KID05_13295, partial [Pseudomonas sp.]|uniref:hypothetical protein n=2 Tax=Pseudomonas TaxID=286 RepID=UPI002357843F